MSNKLDSRSAVWLPFDFFCCVCVCVSVCCCGGLCCWYCCVFVVILYVDIVCVSCFVVVPVLFLLFVSCLPDFGM